MKQASVLLKKVEGTSEQKCAQKLESTAEKQEKPSEGNKTNKLLQSPLKQSDALTENELSEGVTLHTCIAPMTLYSFIHYHNIQTLFRQLLVLYRASILKKLNIENKYGQCLEEYCIK